MNICYILLLQSGKRTYHQRSPKTLRRRSHHQRQRQEPQQSGTTFLSASGNRKKGSQTRLQTCVLFSTHSIGLPMHTNSRSSTKDWQPEPGQAYYSRPHTQHGVNYKDPTSPSSTSQIQCLSLHWPTDHATPSRLTQKKRRLYRVAPEPGVFLLNDRPDTEHMRFYITFDCNISQKTILWAIKTEKVVETLDSEVQEEYPTPVKKVIQAADRAAYILSSNPQQAAADWMAAFPIYTRELTEWSPTALKFQQVQPQICGPEKTADNPATLPQSSTSEVPVIATNFGQPKIRKNLQVTINTKAGGRDIVTTPDTTGPPQPGPPEEPQDLTIKPLDTAMLMAPIPQEETPHIQGLLLQILTNQQQMVSAYHRLGPRTPPLQKKDQPKKSKKAIERDLYFQRKSALHRSRSSSTKSDSARRNPSKDRSPSPKSPKEERRTSRHQSKSPRSRSTRRQDHSKDRSVSPKRPRDEHRANHRREGDRRSPPRHRHQEDRPRPRS
jgi:hypothetical protein